MSRSERKRGLGRGLSALMSDVVVEDPNAHTSGGNATPQALPIEMIEPNPDQPRKSFRDAEMADLVASVREKGIIQPLVVRPIGESRYQLVAGERRWRAAQKASLHQVPVVIRDLSDLEVLEIGIIENIQRADLNPVEEAMGYRQLMDRFGHTQERLADGLGKSRSYIANALRLLQLPVGVLTMLEDGRLSSGHARALITAENPEELARQVVSKGLSVRETEAMVKRLVAKDKASSPTGGRSQPEPQKDADTRALEGDLSAALGMRVTLSHNAGHDGGTLTIRYQSLDQLDELCRVLGGG